MPITTFCVSYALFIFDFFTTFHFGSIKNLLEVLRFYPLLNLGGFFAEEDFWGDLILDLKFNDWHAWHAWHAKFSDWHALHASHANL